MIIYPQTITLTDKFCRVQCNFESKNGKDILWYDIPREFKKHIVSENLDAFLVGLFLLAMKNDEDIHVQGTISAKLYYSLTTYLVPALEKINDILYKIKITVNFLNEENLNIENSSATGLSLGIDSLSTIYYHKNLPGSYGLKFLTFFNAGSHGDFGGEKALTLFNKRLNEVQKFANKIDLPLISINSNISELLKLNFQSTHSVRNLSCILNLQKLIKTYYYASTFRFDYLNFDKKHFGRWDSLIINSLSTESINFVSAMSQLNRVEKTKFISEYSQSYDFLDVCVNSSEAKDKINCSVCNKCMRTQLTLDAIGELDKYRKVFHVDEYYKKRDYFIAEILATKKDNQFNLEIYNLLKDNSVIEIKHYMFLILYYGSIIKKRLFSRLRKYKVLTEMNGFLKYK